jgi:ketosteroid isomerase-like protein
MTQQTMDRTIRNADLVRQGYAAFGRGDLAAVQELFDPGIVWHAQRLGRLGGDHRGWPEVLKFFAETMELTHGTFRMEIQAVLGSDTGAAVILRSIAQRGDQNLDDQQVHIFHLRDERVTEVWQYVGDLDAVSAFWA